MYFRDYTYVSVYGTEHHGRGADERPRTVLPNANIIHTTILIF